MACPPPSSRQRNPTKSGDRFKLRGLLPQLYSRLLIALIGRGSCWSSCTCGHDAHSAPKCDRRRALELRLGAAAARCGEQRFVAMRESPLVGARSVR
jgi:hypothetical protein